jgi:hypothetical protein
VTKNPEEDEIAGFQKFMCANGIPEWKNENEDITPQQPVS